jgi:hypothetical protein
MPARAGSRRQSVLGVSAGEAMTARAVLCGQVGRAEAPVSDWGGWLAAAAGPGCWSRSSRSVVYLCRGGVPC